MKPELLAARPLMMQLNPTADAAGLICNMCGAVVHDAAEVKLLHSKWHDEIDKRNREAAKHAKSARRSARRLSQPGLEAP